MNKKLRNNFRMYLNTDVSNNPVSRTAQQLRKEQVEGVYVPKAKRVERKMEIQRAHFVLGNEKRMPQRSYGQDLIEQSIEKNKNSSGKAEDEAKERRKMVELSRKSNFSLGEDAKKKQEKYAINTSSNVAYDGQKLVNYDSTESINARIQYQADFKKASFVMGNKENKPSYVSTFQDSYLKPSPSRDLVTGSHEKSNSKMCRVAQFTYGTDLPIYQSIQSANFGPHDLSTLDSQRVDGKKASVNERKANFRLGTDKATFRKEDQEVQKIWGGPTPNERSASELRNGGSSGHKGKSAMDVKTASLLGRNVNNQSNFTIRQFKNTELNHFVSLNKQAMESIKHPTPQVVSKQKKVQYQPLKMFNNSNEDSLQKEISKSHFSMGNHISDYRSQARENLVEHRITSNQIKSTQDKTDVQIQKMRKHNFKIPNQKHLNTEQSTYKNRHSDVVEESALAPGKPELLSNLKQSNLTLGTNLQQLNLDTEASVSYGRPNIKNAQSTLDQNQHLKKYLKGHHFDLGSKTSNNQFQIKTLYGGSQFSHRYPANGAEEQKRQNFFQKDQRASHFKMGYDPRPISALDQKESKRSGSNPKGKLQADLYFARHQEGPQTNKSNAYQKTISLPSPQKDPFGRKSVNVNYNIKFPGLHCPTSKTPVGQSSQNLGKLGQVGAKTMVQNMIEKSRGSNILAAQGQSQRGGSIKTSNQAYFRWIQPVQ